MKGGNGHKRPLDDEIYECQAGICKAFANPIRLRILDLIAERAQMGSELQQQLGISTANLSQHLAILKAAGVISAHREGKHLYCSLALPEVKEACRLIRTVLRAQVRSGRRLAV